MLYMKATHWVLQPWTAGAAWFYSNPLDKNSRNIQLWQLPKQQSTELSGLFETDDQWVMKGNIFQF